MEMSNIVASVVLIILQLALGIGGWLLRAQIGRIYKRLDDIESKMLTKSEFELWRQGIRNGRS